MIVLFFTGQNIIDEFRGGCIMLTAARFLCVLILSFTFILPVQTAYCQEEEVQSVPIRVDRTDFPALYLASPNLQGDAVWLVQARLRELGYEIEPNGVFDKTTNDIVCMFQVANNLNGDGKVTREVWEKLMDEETDKLCLTQAEEKNKISIEIDIIKHRLIVYSNGQEIKRFAVGTGKSGTPSPLGEWKIIQKSDTIGGPFGTRWMRLNVPWGVYGVHGTNQPNSIGWNSSHGCIRMRNKDVEALYPLIPTGTTVKIVANGQIIPKYYKTRALQLKSNGQDVVYLQYRLKEKGLIFDNADGKYGAMTQLAVKYYQVWYGLNPSGKADAELYRSLGLIK